MTLTVTDIFCGGGGSSTGMVAIDGIEVVMAANHWDLAVEVHNSNHPDADHAAVDLHEEDPRYFPTTDILWASPECTKWSQASGGKYAAVSTAIDGDLLELLNPELVEEDEETKIIQRSRLLMFDVLRFVEHHRYRAIVVENVVDIATNARFAPEWALWQKGLRNLGYEYRVVSLNSMHAQAHGDPAPQSRDRLYIVCWLKGNRAPDIDKVMRPLAWCPTCEQVVESQQVWKNGRTVGKYRSQYVYIHGACGATVEPGYLPALVAINFADKGQRIGERTKSLSDKTRRRIAAGIAKHWGPFHMEAGGNQYDAADPKHAAHGRPDAYYRTWSMYDTLKTLHTAESKAVVTREDWLPPTMPAGPGGLLMPYYGASKTTLSTDGPIGTLTTVDRYALIQRHNSSKGDGGEMATPATEYLRTLTTAGHQSLITPAREITEYDMKRAEEMVDDCYFRMLTPAEQALATAFPTDYLWGRATKRQQTKLIGNAVTPPAARDLIAAVAEALT